MQNDFAHNSIAPVKRAFDYQKVPDCVYGVIKEMRELWTHRLADIRLTGKNEH